MAEKLKPEDVNQAKILTIDYSGGECNIKITQDGKTANFSSFKASEGFIKNSQFTVR